MKLAFSILTAAVAIQVPALFWHDYGLEAGSLAALISGSGAAWFVAIQMYGLK